MNYSSCVVTPRQRVPLVLYIYLPCSTLGKKMPINFGFSLRDKCARVDSITTPGETHPLFIWQQMHSPCFMQTDQHFLSHVCFRAHLLIETSATAASAPPPPLCYHPYSSRILSLLKTLARTHILHNDTQRTRAANEGVDAHGGCDYAPITRDVVVVVVISAPRTQERRAHCVAHKCIRIICLYVMLCEHARAYVLYG